MMTWHQSMGEPDGSIVTVGLLLFKELLSKSKYPDELQESLKNRIDDMVKKIQTPVKYDTYGNPY